MAENEENNISELFKNENKETSQESGNNNQESSNNNQVAETKMFGHKWNLPEFEYDGDPTTITQRWLVWQESFDLYVQCNEVTKEEVIKAAYLLHIGNKAREIVKSGNNGEIGNMNLQTIKDKLKAHFRSPNIRS